MVAQILVLKIVTLFRPKFTLTKLSFQSVWEGPKRLKKKKNLQGNEQFPTSFLASYKQTNTLLLKIRVPLVVPFRKRRRDYMNNLLQINPQFTKSRKKSPLQPFRPKEQRHKQ